MTDPKSMSMLSVEEIAQILNDNIDRLGKQLDVNGTERGELREKVERLQMEAQQIESDLKRLVGAREVLSAPLEKAMEPVDNKVNWR